MTIEELEKEVLSLEEDERARLGEMLIASVKREPDFEIVQLWAIEAQRRLDEFEQGLTDDMPEEEVFRQVRESLR